jgi:hypothetical protein
LHEKLRDQDFGKEIKPNAKHVPGDFRPQLLPSVALIKPSLPQVTIPQPHIMTEAEIDKMYWEIKKPGPGAHDVDYKLTEKRADIGIAADIYKHDRIA